MLSLRDPNNPWLAMGMTSLVLGFIGLSLFFMPVLGIPVSIFGVGFGILGLAVALFTPATSLRSSLGGICLSCLALGVNVAIANAPGGYLPKPTVPRPWQQAPDRPFVAPPA